MKQIFSFGSVRFKNNNFLLCIVSDFDNLQPVKFKFGRKSKGILLDVNPSTCKVNCFSAQNSGVVYYHHADMNFVPRKYWLECDMKDILNKVGWSPREIVYFSSLVNSSKPLNWIDTDYGIRTIDPGPPHTKKIYLSQDSLTLCGKSVAKIEYDGRIGKNQDLPKEIVLSQHNWTAKDINAIVQKIPPNGLRSFTVYFYDHDMAYRFTIWEDRVNIVIYSGNGCKVLYTHLTPELDESEQIKIGFQMLFTCILAQDVNEIKRKMAKYELLGY